MEFKAIEFDEEGNVMLLTNGDPFISTSPSPGMATNCALNAAPGGNGDMCITKLSSDGTTKLWSSYYGSSSMELAGSIAYMGNGKFAVGGSTQNNAFPGVAGNHQSTFGGTTDGLLTVFSDGRAPEMTLTPTTLSPMSQTACILGIPQLITGNAVTFTTTAEYYSSPVFYQWQVADAPAGPWTDLEGEMFKDLQPMASQTDKYYRRIVQVDDGACTRTPVDTSDVATVLINADVAPIANADGPQWYVCSSPNNTVTLNGSATGGTPVYSYEWFAGSATTPATNTAIYSPAATTPTTYTLRVTDAQGCVDIDQVTVVPVIASPVQPM